METGVTSIVGVYAPLHRNIDIGNPDFILYGNASLELNGKPL